MLTRIVTAVSILCLVLPAAGFAQGFSQGDKVVTLNGTGQSDRGFDNTAFNISGSLGYFLTDRIEAAIRQAVGFSDVGDGNHWMGSTRVALDYDFDLGRVWPFVGGNIGYAYGRGVNDTGVIGPEVGVRVFVNNTTFIVGSAEWDFLFDNGSHNTIKDSFFNYSLGIGFRW